MIELNDAIQVALDAEGSALHLVDPRTKTRYVLVRAEVFDRLKSLLTDDFEPRDAYSAIDEAFAPGWDAPGMSDYDRYEELKG
jgi:predicted ATPase